MAYVATHVATSAAIHASAHEKCWLPHLRVASLFPQDRRVDERECHIDVVAGGVRIRANGVRFLDQPTRLFSRHARQRHLQLDLDAEAVRNQTHADAGADRDVGGNGNPVALTHESYRADKARAVARGEQLFRIRSFSPLAAEFFRHAQFEVQAAFGNHRASVAASRGSGMGGIEHGIERHRKLLVSRLSNGCAARVANGADFEATAWTGSRIAGASESSRISGSKIRLALRAQVTHDRHALESA